MRHRQLAWLIYELPTLFAKLYKTTYIPVSYTHLDVYKRQDLNTDTEPARLVNRETFITLT